MKRLTLARLAALVVMLSAAQVTAGHASSQAPAKKFWVTAYYAGYSWDQVLKPENIDFGPITHLVMFSLLPTKDGGLDGGPNVVNNITVPPTVAATHKAGKKILICVGGQDTAEAYRAAIADPVRAHFIQSIVNWVRVHHVDGVDVDFEPLTDADAPMYQKFIHELRTALKANDPNSILTCAVTVTPAVFGPILSDVDQVNIMSYDLAGPWPEWETWYTSAIYNGGRKFKTVHKPMPCCDMQVKQWIAGGIDTSKLGIGISSWGLIWRGATDHNQPIDGVTGEHISYADIMDKYYKADRYRWDKDPDAPYLSITGTAKKDNMFIVYDDEKVCAEKIAYAHKQGLGGVIIWDLGGAYRPSQPMGQRDAFLKAVDQAINQHMTANR